MSPRRPSTQEHDRRPEVEGSRPTLSRFPRRSQAIAADPYPWRQSAPRTQGLLAGAGSGSHMFGTTVDARCAFVRSDRRFDAEKQHYITVHSTVPVDSLDRRAVVPAHREPLVIGHARVPCRRDVSEVSRTATQPRKQTSLKGAHHGLRISACKTELPVRSLQRNPSQAACQRLALAGGESGKVTRSSSQLSFFRADG
eukprot:CAMPEP_0174880716 /NCGR_PEP_ID=MMETSP1114-20130205/83901_1 /TAXON_ID=312471 /ORGANISM="Neobodo designis, Strain CCAP 1951/1" /LENGTH=197 /DNA_ID=CAMNT_0016116109 /DNA_START=105 /DNA_END=695 /DNA_ORIENTATION=-